MLSRHEIVLTREARNDIATASRWSNANFGTNLTAEYRASFAKLILRAAFDPYCISSFAVSEKAIELRVLHMRAVFSKGRHLVLYRIHDQRLIILRVLHEKMDLEIGRAHV